ncbi:fimbrial protein [Lelliottia amnigena]|jgi:major type 1 subunit fimbrin (pilin)
MTINNKILYTAWLIVSFISCWGINLTSSYAKDAQTNFTTQFDYNGPTCEVTTDNSHISVSLGSVEMSSFKSKGDMSNAVPFNINLDCQFDTPDGVQVRFKGVSPMEDNSLLALDGAGGNDVASGLAIAIFDDENTKVSLQTSSKVYSAPVGRSQLQFAARYIAYTWPVSAGNARATATFEILYP